MVTESVTSTAQPIETPPQPDLARQVRFLRRWLVVLTIVLVLFVVGAAFMAGAALFSFSGFYAGSGTKVDPEQVKTTRQEYEKGLGSDLKSLDVRAVNVDFGGMGGPFPFMSSPKEQALYVEYHLKSSELTFANLQMNGQDPGLLPTQAPISSQMTEEQFRGIVKAYEAESKETFGGVHRYNDSNAGMEGAPATAVSIGGKDYATKDLWVVTQGVRVEGDTFSPNMIGFGPQSALVFVEETKTASFTYLGTDESARWTVF